MARRFAKQLFIELFLVSGALLAPAPALAQAPQAWSGICVENGVATIQGIQCLLANLLSVAIPMIGFAAFIMFIIGGFKYLLSGGNPKGTESARNTMKFAVVGIVISLSAFILLNLISQFTGVQEILDVNIPDSNEVQRF